MRRMEIDGPQHLMPLEPGAKLFAVQLMGGLGNQMFQFAFGRRMAQDLKVPLCLDLSWFAETAPERTPRKYELHRYPLPVFRFPQERLETPKTGLAKLAGKVRRAVGM